MFSDLCRSSSDAHLACDALSSPRRVYDLIVRMDLSSGKQTLALAKGVFRNSEFELSRASQHRVEHCKELSVYL